MMVSARQPVFQEIPGSTPGLMRAAIAAGVILDDDRTEILGVAVASFPLRVTGA
jgi:hypothetical protein